MSGLREYVRMTGWTVPVLVLAMSLTVCGGRRPERPGGDPALRFQRQPAAGPVARGAETGTKGYALLVGCAKYAYLDSSAWLVGPENDVALMQELLTGEMFGFAPERVTTLAGWPDDEARRPTRTNIERAFRQLAEVAGQDDQVVILLSGHGSQQPADEDAEDQEPDGLDEIFLPADVRGWNKQIGAVENAISDDEIRAWLTAIRNRGAFVWITIDACHSGTMTRGAPAGQVRYRRLPDRALGVPEEAIEAAQRRAAQAPGAVRTRGGPGGVDGPVLGLTPSAGGLVAMYAAQSNQLAPEMPLPQGGRSYHGLFSYTIAQVLQQSSSTLTYRELAERVQERYRGIGRWEPTPLIEGGGVDREVLGLGEWPQRARILIEWEDSPGRVQLKAGNLHGLTPGTVLAVYPPAGEAGADSLIGYVKVAEVKSLTSLAEPVEWEGRPAPPSDRLKRGSRCRVAYVDYGDMQMRVALQTQKPPASKDKEPEVVTHAAGKGPAAVEAALATLVEGSSLVARAEDPAKADWYIRLVRDEVHLVPASGWTDYRPRGEPGDTAFVSPPKFTLGRADDPGLAGKLRDALKRIARVTHLLGIADEGGAIEGDEDVDVQVEMIRYKSKADSEGEVVKYDVGGRVLQPGELVAFQVENKGRSAVDVTLLFVDGSYGIQALFPSQGGMVDNRLAGGQSYTTKKYPVTEETVGFEHVVALAVKGEQARMDFAHLAQPALEKVTTRGRGMMDSPLGRLLESAMYEGGTKTRGLGSAEVADYAVRSITWFTVKK